MWEDDIRREFPPRLSRRLIGPFVCSTSIDDSHWPRQPHSKMMRYGECRSLLRNEKPGVLSAPVGVNYVWNGMFKRNGLRTFPWS